MRTFISVILLALLVSFSCRADESFPNRPLMERLTQNTVRIRYKNYGSTGVIVSSNGKGYFVLTVKHLFDECRSGSCSLQRCTLNRIPFPSEDASIVALSSKHDLALLWVQSRIRRNHQRITIRTSEIPINAPLMAFGCGGEASAPYPAMGRMEHLFDDKIITNCPITFGCSGSGLYDSRGRLCGINIGKAKIYCVSVPTKAIVEFLKDHDVPFSTSDEPIDTEPTPESREIDRPHPAVVVAVSFGMLLFLILCRPRKRH